jgi:hypothetical protein
MTVTITVMFRFTPFYRTVAHLLCYPVLNVERNCGRSLPLSRDVSLVPKGTRDVWNSILVCVHAEGKSLCVPCSCFLAAAYDGGGGLSGARSKRDQSCRGRLRIVCDLCSKCMHARM